jgi:hypothetical protein
MFLQRRLLPNWPNKLPLNRVIHTLQPLRSSSSTPLEFTLEVNPEVEVEGVIPGVAEDNLAEVKTLVAVVVVAIPIRILVGTMEVRVLVVHLLRVANQITADLLNKV